MKTVYLLSGLGADKRVFDFLQLPGVAVVHVTYIPPDKSESLAAYAKRLCAQITTQKPTLIGVSFGGILATEIAQHLACDKVILISSAATVHDIPALYRIAGKMRIHDWIPTRFWMNVHVLTYWFFGIKNQTEKILLKQIIQTTDRAFMTWALDKTVTWQNAVNPPNVIKIHGDADRILPVRRADYTLPGGGHFMIVSKAPEISTILHQILR